ncbi:GGDEF domain-containing protein [uncultured Sphingomonas sp.]|uniref:GGDEF domain-containing protein n=1 Tax=uncultured Sphingomonas sp. TaxID=158754 RepID=UPI002629B381|nr:GGDEF domain-containing protein [uncultured Sphingomonas sp.]
MNAIKDLSERTIAFLDGQHLPPTPHNYALGFAYLNGAQTELGRKILSIIDDGVRITQSEADSLHASFCGGGATDCSPRPPAASPPQVDRNAEALRHQTLRLADLAAAAQATTGEFSRELAFRLDGFPATDAALLQELIVATLARSQRSERELAATTLQVEELRNKLEIAQGDAERDLLTGLPNRRGIETHLARACASGDPHVIAMCDIDRFKSYNDRYGHAVGDRVLRTVAASLTQSLDGQFVGRWGGEEFLLVLRADLVVARMIVDDARLALRERHFRLRETDEPMGSITFSAGIATLPADERLIEATMKRADALLYEAKEQGRDRVIAG